MGYADVREAARDTAREVARDTTREVLRGELRDYWEIARGVVEPRFETFGDELMERLDVESREVRSRLADPDVHASLRAAAVTIARSGEVSLRRTLVELVAARCLEGSRDLRAVLLNEAIEVVGRLTGPEVRTMAALWQFSHRRPLEASPQAVSRWLQSVEALLQGAELSGGAIEHLIYLGCVRSEGVSENLGEHLSATYPLVFSRRLPVDLLPDSLRKWEGTSKFMLVEDGQLRWRGPLRDGIVWEADKLDASSDKLDALEYFRELLMPSALSVTSVVAQWLPANARLLTEVGTLLTLELGRVGYEIVIAFNAASAEL